MISRLKLRASALKRESIALYIAARDPRVPWYAKTLMVLILAYAFSPIDLIPDFIPVLGYLDDLIIIPLGISLALKLVPAQVMVDARKEAAEVEKAGKPLSYIGAVIIIGIWLLVLGAVIWFVIRVLKK
jgi:uncharacterized membrane protein YkvA (DUF1232 family)